MFSDLKHWFIIMAAAVAVGGAAGGEYDVLKAQADRDGIKINNALVDISIFSKVTACKPPWQETRFYTPQDPVKFVNTAEKAAMVQDGRFEDFDFSEYSVTLNGNSGVAVLDMAMVKDLPTFMEYTLFSIPEYLLAGAEFTAVTVNGDSVHGTIPLTHSGAAEITYYVRDAVAFTARNNYGEFSFTVKEGPAFTVADRRGVPFEFKRCYWVGTEGDMTMNVRLKSVVDFSYKVNPDLKVPRPLEQNKLTAPMPQSVAAMPLLPEQVEYPALPEVKTFIPETAENGQLLWHTWPGAELTVNGGEELDAVRLQKKFNCLALNGNENAGTKAQIVLNIGEQYAVAESDEGYTINITVNGAEIGSATAKGAFYGLHTLRSLAADKQLGLDLNAMDTAITLPLGTVKDWPDMGIRGIHLAQLDKYSLANFSGIVDKVMPGMKMNFLLLECEFVAWDATKGFHAENAMPKADFIELLNLAADNYIEVVPLVQSLSHAPWLFVGKQNLDLAEDPDYPYAFNTSNPNLYPLVEQVYDEVLATVGKVRYFHIGTDELFLFGRFPHREGTAAKGVQQSVLDYVMWAYEYCKKHDMQLMLWQDIFVTPEESPENGGGGAPHFTAELRKKLPKDIIFTVWRYSGDYDQFKDLDALAAEGFPVIGCSWYNPRNPENLTKEAIKNRALGMLSTTWVYTSHDQSSRPIDMVPIVWNPPPDAPFYYWYHQFAAYIRSGSLAWNAGGKTNGAIESDRILEDLLTPPRHYNNQSGEMFDLSAAANIAVTAENNPFLSGAIYGLDVLPERIGSMQFTPMTVNGRRSAITLKSRRAPDFPENSGRIMLNVKAESLAFLHTLIGDEPEKYAEVAKYIITYADDTTVEFPIRYQAEVGTLETPYNRYLSTANAYRWQFEDKPLKIWYAVWSNPYPERTVKSIELTEMTYPYYLFGLSGILHK